MRRRLGWSPRVRRDVFSTPRDARPEFCDARDVFSPSRDASRYAWRDAQWGKTGRGQERTSAAISRSTGWFAPDSAILGSNVLIDGIRLAYVNSGTGAGIYRRANYLGHSVPPFLTIAESPSGVFIKDCIAFVT